jgi:hypothetical protein
VSAKVGDGSAWGAEQTSTVNITHDGNGNTYTNPFYLSVPNIVYSFSRAIGYDTSYSKWAGLGSTDKSGVINASNFSYGGHFQYWKNPSNSGNGRPYVKYASNGTDTIWLTMTEDSPQNYVNSLYVGYAKFDSAGSGAVYTSTGTALGSISTETAPSSSQANTGSSIASGSGYSYQPAQFTPIAKANTNYNNLDLSSSSPYGAGYAAWASSMRLDSNGKPYLGFLIARNATISGYGNNLEYGYARLVNDTWKVSRIGYAGYALYSGQNQYAGLIAVDPLDPNKVYFPANVDPVTKADLLGPDGKRHWQIFSGTTDGGATWSFTQLTNTSSDNVRPIIAEGSRKEALLWMQGTHTTYTNYNTNIIGLVQFTSPAITSALTATAGYGVAFNYQITSNNNPVNFGATGLPPGLDVNSTTGVISGTASATGTSSVTLVATDSSSVVTGTLSLIVLPLQVTITNPSTSTVTVIGLNTKLHLTATAGTLTPQWAMVSGSGTATFSNANSADTTVQFSQSGTYVLRATASDDKQIASADLTVYVNPPLDSVLALWLKLDEASGSVAVDSFNLGNSCTARAGVVWQKAGGEVGGAAQFGSDSSITVPDSSTLDNTSAFTLSYWFNANSTVDSVGLVANRNGLSDNNAYATFFKTGGLLYVDINVDNDGSSYDRFTSNIVFTTGTWYHVAVVFGGSKVAAERAALYVNGALDKTATETSATVQDSNAPLRVGTLNANAAYFDGIIDVRFYRRALSATEVAALANGTAFTPSVFCGNVPSATSGIPAILNGTITDNGGAQRLWHGLKSTARAQLHSIMRRVPRRMWFLARLAPMFYVYRPATP